jgi:hypothetical protein
VRHASGVRRLRLALAVAPFAACADAPGPGVEDPVPTVAEIVCEADGSTTVRTPQVRVQPDGVHVRGVSRLDEPATVNGPGRDIGPGVTEWVSTTTAPGTVEVACHPFSLHGSGDAPATAPLEILDPSGPYVAGDLECSGAVGHGIGEFAEPPLEGHRIPIDAARAEIRGLEGDDHVFHVGYPEQPDASVAVRRDGQIVASFTFVTFDGEEWVVESSSICTSADLRYMM